MKTRWIFALTILFLGGCRSAGSPAITPTGGSPSLSAAQKASADPSQTPTAAAPAETATYDPESGELAPFRLDLSKPFSDVTLTEWTPGTYGGMTYSLPLDESAYANPKIIAGLTAAERAYLAQYGFVIIHSREKQFADIRQSVSGGQPYFLTVDAAYHALHQNFDDLLKAAERSYLKPRMQAVLDATLQEILSQSGAWAGTGLETDGLLAIAYLSVARKLFDPAFDADPSVRDLVDRQIALILAQGGWGNSPIDPSFADDYGAYKPVGHYAGDPDLENYFRGMTWLGRMHFQYEDKSLLPLIVTLALRRAQLDGEPAAEAWAEMYRVLDFIVGPSDDMGPPEYAALMDAVYGGGQTYTMLEDPARTKDFFSRGDELPPPQINSMLVSSTKDISTEKGWRFMGQRFTIDAFVFQNLIHDRVPERKLPTGLDVMAVFGSSAARSALTEFRLDEYDLYDEQFAKMARAVQSPPQAEWTNRFYTAWLYSFFPLLGPKGEGFPPFMNTEAWGYKEMNSGLGSWAELKHDTVLYAKMPEAAGGGGPPGSGPAPAYVEPNPNAFYRMAYAARSLARGFEGLPFENTSQNYRDPDIDTLLMEMGQLGEQFELLGEIAVKEINGQPVGDDYWTIWGCLGRLECSTIESPYQPDHDDPPEVPVIAAVAGYTDNIESVVLEVGVGYVDRIYVVVPLEGGWYVAQGGVFSYYEFKQPRDNRLTDEEWRAKLDSAPPPALPAWASKFVLTGGKPAQWTIFRVGDWYQVTEEGDGVNLREGPSKAAAVRCQMETGTYVNLIDGPVEAEGYTWWKIDASFSRCGGEGWIMENQDWYVRV